MTFPGHEVFEQFRSDLENRFTLHKSKVAIIQEKNHSENRLRLQNIDAQTIAISVKLNALYGEQGQPGAVDRLATKVETFGNKVDALGNKIAWAFGGGAAVVLLVGWWIAASHK